MIFSYMNNGSGGINSLRDPPLSNGYWPRHHHPGFQYNAAMLPETPISFPFMQTDPDAPDDFVFRPATLVGAWWLTDSSYPSTFWEARYNITIELKNFYWTEDDKSLPPDVASVTVRIRPRTTNLKTGEMTYTEYQTFFTHIPLEPMRWSGKGRDGSVK